MEGELKSGSQLVEKGATFIILLAKQYPFDEKKDFSDKSIFI